MIPVLRSGIHGGEEHAVRGNEKAGMIVFSGCHLACHFCYTPEASVQKLGPRLAQTEFADLLRSLEQKGARNLNFISPTHVWPAIEPVLKRHKRESKIPVVLKFSGFESATLASRFAKVGDVLVPDFKVWDPDLAVSVGLPRAYGAVTQSALARLLQTHDCVWEKGRLVRGIVVRHLLMPGFDKDSEAVLRALQAIGYEGPLNLMTCFVRPEGGCVFAAPSRVMALRRLAREAGMTVWVDGKETA